MTKQISKGYTDTPISGVSSLTFNRGILNFQKDYRVKSNANGKEVVLTNITCPVDRPENIRLAFTEVANIFSGTGIEPSLLTPSKKGISLLAQITNVMSVTDSASPDFRIDQPCSAHLVIKGPSSEYFTADVVIELVGRLLSALYDAGKTDNARLNALLRGSLVPSEL